MKHIYILLAATVILTTISVQKSSAGIFTRKTDSIQIVIDKDQLILPGYSFKVGVISYHKKGKIRKTFGMKGGSVLWLKYKAEVVGGKKSGSNIVVSEKLIPSKGKYIRVKIWPRKKQHLAKTVLVPLNYETEVYFNPTTAFNKAPGCSFKAEIISVFNNGMEIHHNTKSSRLHRDFKITTLGLNRYKNRYYIEKDFTKILDHQVDLWVTSRRNPEVSNSFSILLDYKHNYQLTFSGSSGSDGFNGGDGTSGSTGEDGCHGEDGSDGAPGYHGPDIGVWTDNYFDSVLNCNLLYVFVENFQNGREYRYLINPDGGSFSVSSSGGSGGDGGRGGDGGSGGSGADGRIWFETITKTRMVKKPFTETVTKIVKKTIINEKGESEEVEEVVQEQVTVYREVEEKYTEQIRHQEPGEDGGNGGCGGNGGYGGPGGFGGDIFLFFTDDALKFRKNILAQSFGGSGGFGGSSGSGGSGGQGGHGDPNGNNGTGGYGGSSGISGSSGGSGHVFIEWTEDFYIDEITAINNSQLPDYSFRY